MLIKNNFNKIQLQDITPTILDFFNVKIPKYCKGKSLLRLKQQSGDNILKEIDV